MQPTTILSCGHAPSPHGEHTTGTARLPDGREICWDCAHALELSAMAAAHAAGRSFHAYLSGDKLTDWPGGTLARVTRRSPCKLTRDSMIHDRRSYVSWHAVDAGGRHWHGRGSDGIATTMRPCAR